MMLDARDLTDGQTLSAGVCIVGGGAAGISMALQLVDTGIDVVLLEGGGTGPEKGSQALYAGTVADARLHSPPDRYRQRRFGGSTSIWGGRCAPFDDIDFEYRSWIPHSGWPMARSALLPYYLKASPLCEAGPFQYDVAAAFDSQPRAMIEGLHSGQFTTDTLERFSRPTDFGLRYGARLRAAANIRVLLHANVTSLRLNPAGTRLERLQARALGRAPFEVRARQFVLAAGGLEVARLLLSSRDVHSKGIGNRHDVVGRYYMCHLAGTLGALACRRPQSVYHGYHLSADGIYCRRRLALAPAAQRQLRIGNFIARLHHPRITDPVHRNGLLSLLYLAKGIIPYEYGKRLHGDERLGPAAVFQHLRNVVSDPFATASFLLHWLRYRTLASRKYPSIIIRSRAGIYSLDFHAEQEPNPLSRVQLGDTRDALGQPRLHIDWRYTQGDLDTVRKAIALLAAEFRRCDIGEFHYDPSQIELEMTRYGAYGGHHIGTARMGRDPRSSVVDADCRVHGVDNLFIAGSAVFPTSSQANPTLTIVALALRLADHLKSIEARGRRVASAATTAEVEVDAAGA